MKKFSVLKISLFLAAFVFLGILSQPFLGYAEEVSLDEGDPAALATLSDPAMAVDENGLPLPAGSQISPSAPNSGVGNPPLGTVENNSIALPATNINVSREVLGTPVLCPSYLSSPLHPGSRKTNEVKKLQLFLNTELQIKLPITGFFGPLTTKAVKDFQVKHAEEILRPLGIKSTKPTGLVQTNTLRTITRLRCATAVPRSAAPLLDQP